MSSVARLIVTSKVTSADIQKLQYQLHNKKQRWLLPAALVLSAIGAAVVNTLFLHSIVGFLLSWAVLIALIGITIFVSSCRQAGLIPRRSDAAEGVIYRFYKDWCMVGNPLGADVRFFEYDKLTLAVETRTYFAAYLDSGTLAAVIRKKELSGQEQAVLREFLHRAVHFTDIT